MILVEVVTIGLAGWRLGAMLSYEVGPWRVFERLRDRYTPFAGEEPGFMAQLLACIWCTSVWTTALMAVLWAIGVAFIPALFAAMAVAIMVERWARP